MLAALTDTMNANGDDALLISTIAKSLDMSVTEFLEDAAYTVRVQCSHGREKYFHSPAKDETNSVLKAIFDAMASVRADERNGRSTKKLCPFVSFREAETESSTDDEAVVVGCTYDPSTRVATMRMSDGSTRPAPLYVSGDGGFIKAEWTEPKLSYQLEAPDTYMEADGTGIKKLREIPAASTTVKKKKKEVTKSPAEVALKGKGKSKAKANVMKVMKAKPTPKAKVMKVMKAMTEKPKPAAIKPASEAVEPAAPGETQLDPGTQLGAAEDAKDNKQKEKTETNNQTNTQPKQTKTKHQNTQTTQTKNKSKTNNNQTNKRHEGERGRGRSERGRGRRRSER